MFTLVKTAATILALALASPAFGAISLCHQGQLTAVAQHGAGQAYFYLPLDPSLNAAVTKSIIVAGNDVLIDVGLGPGDGPPLGNPNCFFVTATLPGSLEPGDYTVRWTVRRMVQCPSGICESETATFSQPLTVPEQLVCSAGPTFGPTFDTIPYPPTAGANIKALHASWNVIPYVLTDPVVSISGNQIGIAQTGSYSGPTPPPTIYCISTSAPLGVLPAGHYDLTWQLTTPPKVETYHYSLDVPDSPSIPTLQWPFLLLLALALTATSVSVLRR
jgi:hypothetical protein